jgi:hypothetical protein
MFANESLQMFAMAKFKALYLDQKMFFVHSSCEHEWYYTSSTHVCRKRGTCGDLCLVVWPLHMQMFAESAKHWMFDAEQQ